MRPLALALASALAVFALACQLTKPQHPSDVSTSSAGGDGSDGADGGSSEGGRPAIRAQPGDTSL